MGVWGIEDPTTKILWGVAPRKSAPMVGTQQEDVIAAAEDRQFVARPQWCYKC